MTAFVRSTAPGPRVANTCGSLALLLAAACGGTTPTDPGDGPGRGPNQQTPQIAIVAAPTTVNAVQGGTAQTTVRVTRSGGFAGDVTLAVSGADGDVSATIGQPATADGVTSAVLTAQVAASTPVGPKALVIRASGTGVAEVTTTVQLTVTPAPSFRIDAVAPNPIAITAGETATAAVQLARTAFTGPIILSVDGTDGPRVSPFTATFTPNPVGDATATMTLSAASTMAAGSYSLVIRGQADGLADQVHTVTIEVAAAPAGGSYTLTTSPADAVTLEQGATRGVAIAINRTGGFGDAVNLSVSGAPTGLGATITPTSATGSSATLDLAASLSLAPGTYQLTITGTTGGGRRGSAATTRTVALTVQVTPRQVGSGSIVLDFSSCPHPRPRWIAVQNGAGSAWQVIAAAGDVYRFDLSAPKVGIAILTGWTTAIRFTTLAEIKSLGRADLCEADPVETRNFIGRIHGLEANQIGVVNLGGSTGRAQAAFPQFNINGVLLGTFDALAYGVTPLIGQDQSKDRVMIRRGIDTRALPNGATIGLPFDLATDGRSLARATLGVSNREPNEVIAAGVAFNLNAGCQAVPIPAPAGALTGDEILRETSYEAYGVPASLLQAGENHSFVSVGTTRQGFEITGGRTLIEPFGFGSRTFTLPTPMPTIYPTALSGDYRRLQFQFTLPADVAGDAMVEYTGTGATVRMTATAGYRGSRTVDLTTPDFTGLPGWDASYGPRNTVRWTAIGINTGTQEGARRSGVAGLAPSAGLIPSGAARPVAAAAASACASQRLALSMTTGTA